jgi:hypothetical protein
MLETDYYMNYVGPTLVKVMLDNIDITDKIIPIYGENRNWNGCLWTYKEVFGPDSQGKHFRCDFKADDGKEHWFHGYIHDINQYMNPPLTK